VKAHQKILLLFVLGACVLTQAASDSKPLTITRGNGPGRLIYSDGQEVFLQPLFCQFTLADIGKGRADFFFRELLRAGGEGEFFRISTAIPGFGVGPDYGPYFRITKVPPFKKNSDSALTWVHDERTLSLMRGWLADGDPIFFRSADYGYVAAILGLGHTLHNAIILEKLDPVFATTPSLVITESANEYVLIHERRHYKDSLGDNGFKTSDFGSKLSEVMQQTEVLLADISPFTDPTLVVELVLEQRADVDRLSAMEADLRSGVRRTIAVRKPRTRTRVQVIAFERFIRQERDRVFKNRLAPTNSIYGTPVQEILAKIKARSERHARELRQLIADHMLPHELIGPDKLLPPL